MSGKWRAYFELLRFPAVFTALSNVMMGYLVTRGSIDLKLLFVILLTSSASLYLAGMVLNDVFDANIDALERPTRPIPSGRIAAGTAKTLGWWLLAVGVGLAWLASLLAGSLLSGIVGTLLAGCIVLYDGILKSTLAAPLAMGSCRFLNVLLGMSLATDTRWPVGPKWEPTEIAIALGIGVYIAGLTWFASRESGEQSRPRLLAGILVMFCGLLVLAQSGYMQLRPADTLTESASWPLLWVALAAVILGRCLWAVWRLESRSTQIAVRSSIRALIIIDAAIVLGFCGAAWAWALLALLLPMLLLERWASTT